MSNRRIVCLWMFLMLAILSTTSLVMLFWGIVNQNETPKPSETSHLYQSGKLAESIFEWRKEIETHLFPNWKTLDNLFFAREHLLADARQQPGWMSRWMLMLRIAFVPFFLIAMATFAFVWTWRLQPARERHYKLAVTQGRCLSLWMWGSGLFFFCLASLPWIADKLSPPWAVVKTDQITLRSGNGTSYDPITLNRVPIKLPEGLELWYLGSRTNGWTHVKLYDGTEGWVPDEALIRSGE